MPSSDFREHLIEQVRLFLLSTWERKFDIRSVELWLEQFQDDPDQEKSERTQVLFLLTQFMYFGVFEIRALLRSVFQDHFKYRIVEKLRVDNGMTKDRSVLNSLFLTELGLTRFVGFGNPSESSYHLLYYFRQENSLSKDHFITPDQIFFLLNTPAGVLAKVRMPAVKNYVFIDDLCGSGTQAEEYATNIVNPLKALATSSVRTWYLALFGTSKGIEHVRSLGCFDEVSCVVELDDSFRCFGSNSRYFANEAPPVNQNFAEQICTDYGKKLLPAHPLGYRDSQLLLGFSYNTPDNTLPIFHCEPPLGGATPWTPLFKRFPKF